MPGVSSDYNIVLDRREGKDFMTILVEREPDAETAKDKESPKQIEKRVKAEIMCSGDVEIVDYGSLPRSERKSKGSTTPAVNSRLPSHDWREPSNGC